MKKTIMTLMIFQLLFLIACTQPEADVTTPHQQAITSVDEHIVITESKDKSIAILGKPDNSSGVFHDIQVRINGSTKSFQWENVTSPSFYPELWVANVDDDSEDEIVISLTKGHGTGIRASELHVLNMDFSEIPVDNPKNSIKKYVQTSLLINGEKRTYSITVKNKNYSYEYNNSDAGSWLDDVAFGNIVRYRMQGGAIYVEVSAQVSPGHFIGAVDAVYGYKDSQLQIEGLQFIENR